MEWYHYIGIILCYILSGILDGERDTIVYKVGSSWFKGGYWTEGNYMLRRFKNPIILWLLKKPFSFLNNGWHLCKSTSLVFLILPFAIINPYLDWYLFVIAFYIYYGIVFNISYDY